MKNKGQISKLEKPWKVFLVHHTHVDIGYTHYQETLYKKHARMIDEVLDYCSRTDKYPDSSRFRWTCEVAWTVKNYLEQASTKKIQEFIRRVKEGRIEITGIFVNPTDIFSYEELIRSLYFACQLAGKNGFKITSAMNSDINGMSWFMPDILSGAGIQYLSMSTDPIMAPTLGLPGLFYWKSPSGKKVLTWNTDLPQVIRSIYTVGYDIGFGKGYKEVSKNLPEYLLRLEEGKYPYEAVGLRIGKDNVGPHIEVSQIAREWNSKFQYPEIIVATASHFMKYMETHYRDKIPAYCGAWPDWWANGHGSCAWETGLTRQVDEELSTAEKLFSFLNTGWKIPYPKERLDNTYIEKILFDEHTYGDRKSVSEPDCLLSKAEWAVKSNFIYKAAVESSDLLRESLEKLASGIATDDRNKLVVFNALSFERTDIVKAKIPAEMLGNKESLKILDGKTIIPCQIIGIKEEQMWDEKGGGGITKEKVIEFAFVGQMIPSLGYKVYEVDVSDKKQASIKSVLSTNYGMENKFYKIQFDPITGGIKSIYDKQANKELVDKKSPYKLSQYIYEELVSKGGRKAFWDGDIKRKAKFRRTSSMSAKIMPGMNGPVFGEMVVKTSLKGCPEIIQKVILYNDIKRIDISTRLIKEEVRSPEALYCAFPFNIDRAEIRFEIAGGVMKLGDEQIGNSARDYYSVQRWINISNRNQGVIWSTREAPLVHFSDINTGKWLKETKQENSTFFSWMMNNYWDCNWRAAQSGTVEFNHAITSYSGKRNNVGVCQFGLSWNSPLRGVFLKGDQRGIFPERYFSFCRLDKQNVIISTLKKAEDRKGIIIRVVEVQGQDTKVKISLPYIRVERAYLTDNMENKQKRLKSGKNFVQLSVQKSSTVSVYLSVH